MASKSPSLRHGEKKLPNLSSSSIFLIREKQRCLRPSTMSVHSALLSSFFFFDLSFCWLSMTLTPCEDDFVGVPTGSNLGEDPDPPEA